MLDGEPTPCPYPIGEMNCGAFFNIGPITTQRTGPCGRPTTRTPEESAYAVFKAGQRRRCSSVPLCR
jgi:hypothetical protein